MELVDFFVGMFTEAEFWFSVAVFFWFLNMVSLTVMFVVCVWAFIVWRKRARKEA
jgi:hypothetical protein